MAVSETGRCRLDLAEVWLRYAFLAKLNHLRDGNAITFKEELPNKRAIPTCVLLCSEYLSWVQVNGTFEDLLGWEHSQWEPKVETDTKFVFLEALERFILFQSGRWHKLEMLSSVQLHFPLENI